MRFIGHYPLFEYLDLNIYMYSTSSVPLMSHLSSHRVLAVSSIYVHRWVLFLKSGMFFVGVGTRIFAEIVKPTGDVLAAQEHPAPKRP